MNKEIARHEDGLPNFRQPSDIIEREDGFHIFMDMPAVSGSDLCIDLEENELVVSGPAVIAAHEGEKVIETEFGGCQYRRAFNLSNTVDRDNISANLKDGVLELTLPKAQKALPKRIEIQQG